MSKRCQDQLTRVQKLYVEDAQADRSFIVACKKDLLQHECRKELRAVNGSDTIKLAALILCLESAIGKGESIEPECQAEILDRRRMFMTDFQLSPNLVKECRDEIGMYCDGGVERDGKTVRCLLRNYLKFMKGKKKGMQFKSTCANQVCY